MTSSDAPDFIARLTALSELFGAKLSEAVQVIYFEALQDIELSYLVRAFSLAAKECKFMPKPVELRDLALGSPDEFAADAWNEWKDSARRLGAYQNISMEPEMGFALIETFGSWPEACRADLSPEMWASKRKQFVEAFKRHNRRIGSEYAGKMCLLSGVFAIERGEERVSLMLYQEIEARYESKQLKAAN